MSHHTLYDEDSNVLYNMELYNVGDIIEYIPNNQLGYLKFKVVLNNNEKELEVIEDIYGKV